MTERTVKDRPYPFAGAGHHLGWKCIRCAQVRPIAGSRQRRWKGVLTKLCRECIEALA